ncbi:hypothetical protein ACIQ9P_33165 [Kitasatospora sp. NPDC094019]|uniref:hypothetical protein n=1 Tax=Kitasatospora sp. NPDC094019 TaxID=3364091 RepID=UPI0037F2926B
MAVTFAEVSRRSGVSTRYLRSQDDLASAIVALRAGNPRSATNSAGPSRASMAALLAARVSLLEQLLLDARSQLAGVEAAGCLPEQTVAQVWRVDGQADIPS